MIYVAGKIRGLENYKLVFNAAKKFLNKHGLKHTTAVELLERIKYMQLSENLIINAINNFIYYSNTIYVIPNWKKSNGTKLEIELAKYYNKEIVYLEWNHLFDEKFIKDYQEFFRCDFKRRDDKNKIYKFLLINYLSSFITSNYKLGTIIYSRASNPYSTLLNAKYATASAIKGTFGIEIQNEYLYKKELIKNYIEEYYAS